MGWNTSALFVAARKPKKIIAFLPDVFEYERTGEKVGGDQATSGSPGGKLYVRELDGWCEIWEPSQRLLPRIETILEDAPNTLVGTKALVLILSSVTSTYGFLLFDNAELVRKVIYKQGKCVENVGEPLAFEASFKPESWGHDEHFVWTALRVITGRAPNIEGSYDVYNVIT